MALALPAHAQTATGDLTAFCAARIEANAADTKADNIAVLTKMVASAPAAVRTPMADLLALVKKQGDKAFESKAGTALLATLEPYIYENCPGRQLAVTAIDYEYQGIPATLPAGVTKIKLTNAAPKEGHMMVIAKLTAGRRGDGARQGPRPARQEGGEVHRLQERCLHAGRARCQPGMRRSTSHQGNTPTCASSRRVARRTASRTSCSAWRARSPSRSERPRTRSGPGTRDGQPGAATATARREGPASYGRGRGTEPAGPSLATVIRARVGACAIPFIRCRPRWC